MYNTCRFLSQKWGFKAISSILGYQKNFKKLDKWPNPHFLPQKMQVLYISVISSSRRFQRHPYCHISFWKKSWSPRGGHLPPKNLKWPRGVPKTHFLVKIFSQIIFKYISAKLNDPSKLIWELFIKTGRPNQDPIRNFQEHKRHHQEP